MISPSSPRPLTGVSSQPRNEATLSFRASVAALHAANCVLGDINESNMLVSSDALITMVLYQWIASPASPQNAIFKPIFDSLKT